MLKSFEQFLLTEAIWDKTRLLKGKNLLYHYTKNTTLIKILNSDLLKAHKSHHSWKKYPHNFGIEKDKALCFTRNHFINFRKNSFCLILDKDLLQKAGYKFQKIALYGKSREDLSEEFVTQNITNLKKYIIGIGVSKHLGISNGLEDYTFNKINISDGTDLFYGTDLGDFKFFEYTIKIIPKVFKHIKKILHYNIPVISLYSGESITNENIKTTKLNTLKNLTTLENTITDPYYLEHKRKSKQEVLDLTHLSPQETFNELVKRGYYKNNELEIKDYSYIKINSIQIPKYCSEIYIDTIDVNNIQFEADSIISNISLYSIPLETLDIPKKCQYLRLMDLNNLKQINVSSVIDFILIRDCDALKTFENILVKEVKLFGEFEKIVLPKECREATIESKTLKELTHWKNTYINYSNNSDAKITILE